MAESRATVPDFTATVAIDVTSALAACTQLGGAIELDDHVVKACGIALREHPRVNASYRDARFELHGRVNIGFAVWTEGSFLAPTLFDADTTPVAELARARRELTESVRAGTVTSPALAGATFSIASAAVTRFAPIITPPHAAALAVGTPDARLTAELTLACDHRILVAADAAAFLGRVGELLERPALLLVP
jgi:pyruvate dehydrogenase E2 component (dihydrolipoamide acetyltransferase)